MKRHAPSWSRREAAGDAVTWVQSPVELTPELRDAINALGSLRHIVSPNFEHVKFAREVRHQCQITKTTHVVSTTRSDYPPASRLDENLLQTMYNPDMLGRKSSDHLDSTTDAAAVEGGVAGGDAVWVSGPEGQGQRLRRGSWRRGAGSLARRDRSSAREV